MTLIAILSKREAKEFDEPPVFDSLDRKRFYDLTIALNNIITTLRPPENKVLFSVSYAYFKARKRFYDRLTVGAFIGARVQDFLLIF